MNELDRRCETVSTLATRYLEQELSDVQQTSYETHLVVCENCVSYLGDIRTLVETLNTLPEDAVDDKERRCILEQAARR